MAKPETQPEDLATAATIEPGVAPTMPATRPGGGNGEAAVDAAARTLDAPIRLGAAPGSAFRRTLPGRFVAEKEIARGGMGRVIAARDRDLDRPVALKQLLDPEQADVARFRREARITARLQHPSIVPVYEAGLDDDGQPFFAMKKLEGQPLDRAIAARPTLAERLALLPKVIAVADALAFAHSRGVVHRDLKPANVLVGEFGETVVIDWGIARDLAATDESGTTLDATPKATPEGLTMAGAVMGTPAYMAPEQARGEQVDARADVYALGAILYELLAGRAPYDGKTSLHVLMAVVSGKPEPLAALPSEAPPELRAIVLRAMAREKEARYADAGALARDLESYQTGQLVGAHRYTAGELVRRWVMRHRAAVLTSTLGLVMLVSLGVWSYVEVTAERNAALDAQAAAEAARREALDDANAAIAARAASFVEHDPARAVATLRRVSVDGAHWDDVREVIAAAAARGLPTVLYTPDAPPRSASAWSPDGTRLARAYGAHSVLVADRTTGTHRRFVLPTPDATEWVDIAFSEGGASLVLVGPTCHDCRDDDHACTACDAARIAVVIDLESGEALVSRGDAALRVAGAHFPAWRARLFDGHVVTLASDGQGWIERGVALPRPAFEEASVLLVTSTDGSRALEAVCDEEGVWLARTWRFDVEPALAGPTRTLEAEWLFVAPDARHVVPLPETREAAIASFPAPLRDALARALARCRSRRCRFDRSTWRRGRSAARR